MRTLVIGDIHGRYEAFIDVLKKSNFDYKYDKLIVLGDVCDGDVGVREVIDTLLGMKKLVYILGNHDKCSFQWMIGEHTEYTNRIWWNQGGIHTVASYDFKKDNVPIDHKVLFSKAKLYHEEKGCLFVHGGIDPSKPIDKQEEHTLLWDRQLIEYAKHNKVGTWNKVFIGHTTTEIIEKGKTTPITFNNLIMMDTGAGWTGKLTIMDIDTEEYWQSEKQTPGPSKTLLKKRYFKEHNTPLTKKRETVKQNE